jgi:hypothetical protein
MIFEIGSNWDDLIDFVEVFDTRFPGLFDAGNQQYSMYNIPHMVAPYPKDFIVDQDGRIAYWSEQYDPQEIMQVIDGLIGYTDVSPEEGQLSLPSDFHLGQNFPNPFNPTTVISYRLPVVDFVNLSVYDIAGRQVAELVNGWRNGGVHEVTFDASNMAAGVYFYQLRAEGYSGIGKMVLLK